MQPITNQSQMFDPLHEDFLQQMLSSVTSSSSSSSWRSDLSAATDSPQPPCDPLSQTAMSLMLQQRLIASSAGNGNCLRSPTGGLLPLPLSLNGCADHNQVVGLDVFPNSGNDVSGQSLYNGWINQPSHEPQHFQQPQEEAIQTRNLGVKSQPAVSGSTGTGGGGGTAAQPPQPKVRARRGQATDPHSIAERLRRERIAQRMKGLQELVPNANKTDKASMLEEIIDYVKFLQLQVKVLSMSRLGGSAAIAPLLGEMSSERSNGTKTAPADNGDSMTGTEQQVAKLMEEDVGSAMQYLQGKGLCLMPLSLASVISTATSNMNPKKHGQDLNGNNLLTGSADSGVEEGGGPLSPSLSGLTVQSATISNGVVVQPR